MNHAEQLHTGTDVEAQLRTRLEGANALSRADFARAERLRQEQLEPESLVSLLIRMGIVSERTMADTLAELLQLPLARPAEFPPQSLSDDLLSSRFLKETGAVVTALDDDSVTVALADPTVDFTRRALALATRRPVNLKVGVASEIQQALDRQGAVAGGEQNTETVEPVTERDVAQLRDMASEAPVIRLVNQLVQRAVDCRASDIHVEPFENRLKIRYRIDGVLRDEMSPGREMGPAIISRIKILANLDIAERRLPQDGRINLRVQGRELDIRVSTIPTMYGESVVMRLLQREAVALDFDSLGFTPDLQQRFKHNLDLPHGMILVTGPTGSGKTTTLYTALNSLNTEARKVITVEDPVEYNLEGINQIQVNSAIGLTFASCLRSIVRQDPDVIMVGEMRDLETARICVQSALTGHLVLSTLHTNDAASSVTRLLEMGVEDYLLNSTLNLVIAQRLVRVLCPHCKSAYTAPEAVVREYQLRTFAPAGEITLWRSNGCEACSGTGYRGRTGIVEMLALTDILRDLILEHASAGKIEQVARREGMLTMLEDGCHKVLAGVTTLEEIVRVTQET